MRKADELEREMSGEMGRESREGMGRGMGSRGMGSRGTGGGMEDKGDGEGDSQNSTESHYSVDLVSISI